MIFATIVIAVLISSASVEGRRCLFNDELQLLFNDELQHESLGKEVGKFRYLDHNRLPLDYLLDTNVRLLFERHRMYGD